MRRRVVLVLASFLLALFAVELGARLHLGERFEFGAWVGPPQAILGRFDAELGWAGREGTSARIKGHRVSYFASVNEHGQRGRERTVEKAGGVVRVLLLGDSTSWGWGVGDDEAFAHLIEERLDVEVINLAVPGYSTDQHVLQLEREGWDWDPDVVLLGLVHNDVVALDHPEYHGMQKPMFERAEDGDWRVTNSPVPAPTGDSGLVDRYLLRRLSMYFATAKLFLPPPPEYQRPPLENPNVVARIDAYWDRLVDPDSTVSMLLERMSGQCEERGVPLFAFVLPHLHDRYLYDPTWPRPDVPKSTEEPPFRTHGSQRLASAAQRLGFEGFSVDRALLDATGAGETLDGGDEHLNARGNEIVAGVIADALRETVERLR